MTTKCLRLEGVGEHVVSMTFVLFESMPFFYDFMWLVLPWTVYTLKRAQTAAHVYCACLCLCAWKIFTLAHQTDAGNTKSIITVHSVRLLFFCFEW